MILVFRNDAEFFRPRSALVVHPCLDNKHRLLAVRVIPHRKVDQVVVVFLEPGGIGHRISLCRINADSELQRVAIPSHVPLGLRGALVHQRSRIAHFSPDIQGLGIVHQCEFRILIFSCLWHDVGFYGAGHVPVIELSIQYDFPSGWHRIHLLVEAPAVLLLGCKHE